MITHAFLKAVVLGGVMLASGLSAGCGMQMQDGNGDAQMRQGREEVHAGVQQVRDALGAWKVAPSKSSIADMRNGMDRIRAGRSSMGTAMASGHCQHQGMQEMMSDMDQAITSMSAACDMMEDQSGANDESAARTMDEQTTRIDQDLAATTSCAEHCGSMM